MPGHLLLELSDTVWHHRHLQPTRHRPHIQLCQRAERPQQLWRVRRAVPARDWGHVVVFTFHSHWKTRLLIRLFGRPRTLRHRQRPLLRRRVWVRLVQLWRVRRDLWCRQHLFPGDVRAQLHRVWRLWVWSGLLRAARWRQGAGRTLTRPQLEPDGQRQRVERPRLMPPSPRSPPKTAPSTCSTSRCPCLGGRPWMRGRPRCGRGSSSLRRTGRGTWPCSNPTPLGWTTRPPRVQRGCPAAATSPVAAAKLAAYLADRPDLTSSSGQVIAGEPVLAAEGGASARRAARARARARRVAQLWHPPRRVPPAVRCPRV